MSPASSWMTPLTPQQWDKFRRYVQPGCRCRLGEHPRYGLEGFLIENWPYSNIETHSDSPEPIPSYPDVEEKLRFQPFRFGEVIHSPVSFLEFLVDDTWLRMIDILALPDTES
jgi:hypothetical protein